MQATYRLPRSNLYLLVPGLPFCLFLASVGLFAGDAPHPLPLRVMFGGAALAFGALCAYCAWEAHCARLIIDGARLKMVGSLKSKEIDCTQVREARWSMLYGGCLKLFDGTTRITVPFRRYAIPDRVSFIDHLRDQVPDNVQTGWPWFEDQYFRRLLEVDKPGPDRVLVDRRRLDRWILPTIAVIVMIGVATAWWARDARALVVAVLSSAVLIAHRFLYPRKPYYARMMSACFREQPEMKWMLMLFPLAIAGKFVCTLSPHLLSDALGWCAAGALFAVQCGLIASMFVRERRRKRRVEANGDQRNLRRRILELGIDGIEARRLRS